MMPQWIKKNKLFTIYLSVHPQSELRKEEKYISSIGWLQKKVYDMSCNPG